jgi:hypothetical protein
MWRRKANPRASLTRSATRTSAFLWSRKISRFQLLRLDILVFLLCFTHSCWFIETYSFKFVSLRPENTVIRFSTYDISFFISEAIFEAMWRKSARQQAGQKKSGLVQAHFKSPGGPANWDFLRSFSQPKKRVNNRLSLSFFPFALSVLPPFFLL